VPQGPSVFQMPARDAGERPHWSATFREKPVLNDCALGLATADAGESMAESRIVNRLRCSKSTRPIAEIWRAVETLRLIHLLHAIEPLPVAAGLIHNRRRRLRGGDRSPDFHPRSRLKSGRITELVGLAGNRCPGDSHVAPPAASSERRRQR